MVKHLKKYGNFMKMILALKHFNKHDHDLNNYGKFIIIELLRNICPTTTETIKERVKQTQTIRFSATPDVKYSSFLVNHKFFIWYPLRMAAVETSWKIVCFYQPYLHFPSFKRSTFPLLQDRLTHRQTDRQTDKQKDRQINRYIDR